MALKESPYNKPSMALKESPYNKQSKMNWKNRQKKRDAEDFWTSFEKLFWNEFMNRLAHALKKENQYQCHVKYNSTKPRYSDQQIKQNSM